MINNINSVSTSYTSTPSVKALDEEQKSTFSDVSGYVGSAASAGASSYLFSAKISQNMLDSYALYEKGGNVGDKIKRTVLSGPKESINRFGSLGVGLAVSGIISSVANGIDVLRGKKTGDEAVGTVAADTVHGGIAAMTAVSISAGATYGLTLLAPAFTGTPLLATTMGLGVAAAVGVDFLLKKIGFHDAIKDSVKGMLNKSA